MNCVCSSVVETPLNSTKEGAGPEIVLFFVPLRHLSLHLSPVSAVHSLPQCQLVWLLCLDGSKMHPHYCPYCPLNNETIYDHYISTLAMISIQLHFLELQYH